MSNYQVTIIRYTGNFTYNGVTIPGEITYKKEKGIIDLKLTQLYNSSNEYSADIDEQRTYEEKNRIRIPRTPIITGTLHNNDKVTLFNCRRSNDVYNGNVRILTFRADYLVFDDIQNTTPKYNRFTFVVENALLWSGMTQVVKKQDKYTQAMQIQFRTNNYSKSFHWGNTKVKFSTILDHTDLLKFERLERAEVLEFLKIQLISQTPISIDSFLKLRDQILAMISFAIKDNVNIVKQYFCTEDDFHAYEKHNGEVDRDYTQYTIFTNEKQRHLIKPDTKEYNFFLKDLPERKDLSKIIGYLLPIFSLYTSFFHYSDMPLEMLFLNVTQALETFHSRFFYNNRKDNMITSVNIRHKNKEIDDEARNQLLIGERQSHILLSARFSDLFIRGKDGLFAEFYKENPDYAYRIAETRNYYTHYPQETKIAILEGNELFDTIQILKWVLEYHVCVALGIKDMEQKVRFKLYPAEERELYQNLMQAYYEKYGFET